MLGVLGLENLLDGGTARRRSSSRSPSAARRRAAARDFAEADRLRDELRARGLGGRATAPAGPELRPGRVTRP